MILLAVLDVYTLDTVLLYEAIIAIVGGFISAMGGKWPCGS